MSVILRGAKNAVRNPIRTGSIIVLLGVATAFALSLLLANQAVKNKLLDLKTSGATVLTVSPAGAQGFQGGGEPLTTANYDTVSKLANIADISAQLSLNTRQQRLVQPTTSTGGSGPTTFRQPDPATIATENKVGLESAIEPGTIGQRNFGGVQNDNATEVPKITIPVTVTGIKGNLDANGTAYSIKSGTFLTDDGGYNALISTSLATKNNLAVGGTFTAYDQTFTVIGIYDTGNDFQNNSVLVPLDIAQTVGEQPGELSTIIVKANSIENLDNVKTAITSALGADKASVASAQQNTADAIASLQSVEHISIAGVVIALAAAAVIVFLIMVMIVRERRREIAILKAIGASNIKIVGQFVTEAIVLTAISVVIGMLITLAGSNRITSVLVSSNTQSTSTAANQPVTSGGGRAGGLTQIFMGGEGEDSVQSLVSGVKTDLGLAFLLQGLGAIVLIAALGSAIPAFAIAKIRPAEVMRGDS